MIRSTVCIGVTVCALTSTLLAARHAVPARDDSKEPRRLVLRSQSQGTIRFLPQPVLGEPVAKWRSSSNAADKELAVAVEEALDAFDRAARRFPQCDQPPVADTFDATPPPQRKSLQDLVNEADVAVIGRVQDVVSGWGLPDQRVLSVVELKVETVLAGSLSETDSITYVQSSGELRIGDRRACSSDYSGFIGVERGARVLLIGWKRGEGSSHIDRRFVFPVREGRIVPQPYPTVVDEAIGVRQLRRSTGGAR